ncbi:hypothetical protein [Streptomyces sp. NPDC046759]|uniref:hypothetical protein n=1 Tax=Streptomyces sp. NPDC046759 TaxID=3155019 RepID=UPI0033DBA3D6
MDTAAKAALCPLPSSARRLTATVADAVHVHTECGRHTRPDPVPGSSGYVWENDEDTATLRNDHGRFIDAVPWGRNTAATAEATTAVTASAVTATATAADTVTDPGRPR